MNTEVWQTSDTVPHHSWTGREKAWLTYAGSLTAKLRFALQGEIDHRLRFEGWGRSTSDESKPLNIAADSDVWVRDIDWMCDDQLLVAARVVIPKGTLTGKGRILQAIGNRSIGDVLFSDPHLKRGQIEVIKLKPGHPYHQKVRHHLAVPLQSVWARRSLFYFHGQPLLICEIFLSPVFDVELTHQKEPLLKRLSAYGRLMRFDRPIGILLLLWPMLWALWIAARGLPKVGVLGVFVLGAIVMRAAGCVINDVADRKIDSYVKRTKKRPLATGEISAKAAIVLFVALCAVACLLVLSLNALTIQFAAMGVLITVIYPFMKRHTHWPQLVLGVAFAWSVPMAFAAQIGHVPGVAWVLFAAAVCWPIAYDTQYAMVDRADDINIGVKSTAVLFGGYDRFMIGLFQGAMLVLLLLLGVLLQLSFWFYVGLSVAAALMGYQQYLIRHREPAPCFRAFLNNHWVGLVIFIGLFVHSI